MTVLEREYRRGDTLFEEGDRSSAVFRVLSGSVDLQKNVQGQPVVVGTVTDGFTIDELASIVDRNRVISARVSSDTATLQIWKADEYLRHASEKPDLAYEVMTRMREKLHASTRRTSDIAPLHASRSLLNVTSAFFAEEVVAGSESGALATLLPQTDYLKKHLPADGIAIATSPFIVGREETDGERSLLLSRGLNERRKSGDRRQDAHLDPETGRPRAHLTLQDAKPYRLSRIHFSIQKLNDGSFIVRDLGSALGTRVNDEYLGVEFAQDFTKLQAGENEIVAGGRKSPFVFRVVTA